MVDRDRALAKLDDLQVCLAELRQIAPASLEECRTIEKRRACERLLQLSIECVIDVCHLLVAGRQLGLPGEENDIFEKREHGRLISAQTVDLLKRMKGCRNILVHEYARVVDEIIFEAVTTRLGDFDDFRKEILETL